MTFPHSNKEGQNILAPFELMAKQLPPEQQKDAQERIAAAQDALTKANGEGIYSTIPHLRPVQRSTKGITM
jgi:hypothetical protein